MIADASDEGMSKWMLIRTLGTNTVMVPPPKSELLPVLTQVDICVLVLFENELDIACVGKWCSCGIIVIANSS